jgi:protein O-mannosyl-transferase
MGKARRRKAAPDVGATPGRSRAAQLVTGPPAPVPPSWLWVGAAVVVIATTIAFLPALGAQFVTWDDPDYVAKNALLQGGADGLAAIWNPFRPGLPQYYPLVFTSYWAEYRMWGLAPAGYHITNVLLHLANTILVLLVVRRLGASEWVALVATGLFALHPVQVESVVWVTERKNTLSLLLYLSAVLLYLRHRRTGSWAAYGGALLAFVAALLSKTQTLTLPLTIVITEWVLQRSRRLPRLAVAAVLLRVAPMLALAAASSMITTMVERRVAPPWAQLPDLWQRLLIAPSTVCFYVGTFLAPYALAPIYPRAAATPSNLTWWAGLVTIAAGAVVLARRRGRTQPLLLWGAAVFAVSLLPVTGIITFTYQHYAYVADRFLYVASIGAAVAIAVLLDQAAGAAGWTRRRQVVTLGAVSVLAGCAVLTYRHATYWENDLTFWTYAVARNAESYPPNINLGRQYGEKGEWATALPFFRKAHELQPTDTYALTSYLDAVSKGAGPQAVIDVCTEEVKAARVNAYAAYLYRATAYETLGRLQDAAADYDRVLSATRRGSVSWQQAQAGRQRIK